MLSNWTTIHIFAMWKEKYEHMVAILSDSWRI
jgi:hypothetical protein